jgi:hypothetical protein
MPDVVPFLTYEDGIAALEWLAEVFGFTETGGSFKGCGNERKAVTPFGCNQHPRAECPYERSHRHVEGNRGAGYGVKSVVG